MCNSRNNTVRVSYNIFLSRFMGEGLAGISEDTEASTQNQTTEATLMENRNDGKASSGEDNANVASGVNALGRISNLLIGKSV